MIRLIDVILENAPDEAKRLGLVRKPGFGLYGPPGDDKPATHKSMLGRLVQLAQDNKPTQSQQPTQQKQDTPAPSQQKTQQPSVTQQKSVARSSSPIGRTRVYEVTGLSNMVSSVSSTFGADGKIKSLSETLDAVTRQFGRETAPQTTVGGDALDKIFEFEGTDTTMGLYNPDSDTIQMSPKLKGFIDTPISDWGTEEILAFKTYTHEAIHSASPRLKAGNYEVINDPISLTIEEGLTEYIAQGIALGAIESKNPKAQDVNGGEGYRGYTDAVEFMSKHGNLNVNDVFRNPKVGKVKDAVRRAQFEAVLGTLKEAGADKETEDKIYGAIQVAWQDKETILLTDEKFAQAMSQIRQQLEAGTPLSSEKIKETLKDYL